MVRTLVEYVWTKIVANPKIVFVAVFLAMVAFAWANRFVQDDGLISFRYAEHLAHGKGLVFNHDEKVEGYTNFLWTLMIAGGIKLGFDPIRYSYGLGIVLFSLHLLLVYLFAKRLFGSPHKATYLLFLLGTNYSFSAYATGGLETQLQSLLVTLTVYLAWLVGKYPLKRTFNLFALSLVYTLMLLNRLDSALVIAATGTVLLIHWFHHDGIRAIWPRLAVLAPLPLVVVGAWLFWKFGFYGDILPNTFYVKASSVTSLYRGAMYVFLFLESYMLFPIVALFLYWVFVKQKGLNFGLWLCLAPTLLMVLYIFKVGGDFMEFRFFIPIMPLIYFLVGFCVFQYRSRHVIAAFALFLVSASLHHKFFYKTVAGVHQIEELHDSAKKWAMIGKELGDSFQDKNVRIAVVTAGAIPYYSKLYSIDMMGLTDSWVAKYGDVFSTKPGHQKVATLDYLKQRQVELVVGQPLIVKPNDRCTNIDYVRSYIKKKAYILCCMDQLPSHTKIIEIDVQGHFYVYVWYMQESNHVEQAIAQKGWRVFNIS